MHKLREWRAANEFTLTDAAGLTGYTEAYLSLIERDLRNPPARTKVIISRRLGARVEDLFEVEPVDETGES